jgi:hypothetical protein
MGKAIFISAVLFLMHPTTHAQDNTKRLQQVIAKLDNATAVKDYQQLANDFAQMAEVQKT